MEYLEAKPLLCRYKQEVEGKALCIVNNHGLPIPVEFPLFVITHYNFKPGEEFHWYLRKGGVTLENITKDIKPIIPVPLSQAEIDELNEFISRGQTMEECLAEYKLQQGE